MGRSSCCDDVGIKKGPWTPEEDMVLVSYIQEHGPRNWRLVPTNTGLMRCSKSCRLRWTNYLRPGIKRGNFTPQEERMIIHLQALLGNRWAAIASYLPQRTDNDIKNYWNTHLKKRIKKHKTAVDSYMTSTDLSPPSCDFELAQPPYSADTRTQVISTLHPTLPRFFHTSSTYASSTENISRLLKGWMMPTADSNAAATTTSTSITSTSILVKPEQENITFSPALSPHEQLDSLLSFDNLDCSGWDNSSTGITFHETIDEARQRSESSQAPLSLFDTWLRDEAAGQIEGLMEQRQQQ